MDNNQNTTEKKDSGGKVRKSWRQVDFLEISKTADGDQQEGSTPTDPINLFSPSAANLENKKCEAGHASSQSTLTDIFLIEKQ